MLTLYHAPKSRSSRFVWLLEEIGAPYELERVDIRRGDGSGVADAGNPHPHGKVPALVHDGAVVFESVAIALYLSDAFPNAKLGPAISDPQRGIFLTMLAYYAGVMEPAFMSKFQKTDVPRGTAGWVVVEEAMDYINQRLATGPYMCGAQFTAADILYGSTFALFRGNPMLPETPLLANYVERCIQRPAYARAAEKDFH
jgi:glutathione S-transferase